MDFVDYLDYLNQPMEISLETFAFCNASCTFCPYPTLERKGTRMSEDLMYRLLDEMSDFKYPFTLAPFKVNEPFLDRRLMQFLRTANTCVPHASLRLFSNGSPLTSAMLESIAELNNVTHLWVSLNSVEADEYHRIMGLDFLQVIDRLDCLHRMIGDSTFNHPVVISKVCSSPDESLFVHYCQERWPRFQVQLIKQDSWLGYVAPLHPDIHNTPCTRWFELSILATGVVSLCCMDGTGAFPIGDVTDASLFSVYNHPSYRDRRLHMVSRKTIHPCRTCSY